MAFLTLSTYGDVPVQLDAGSAELSWREIGRREAAYSTVLHNTVRARLRRWRVVLSRVPRLNGDLILEGLKSASPITCSGDLIDIHGGSAACLAELVSVKHPKHADGEYQLIEFTLHEASAATPWLLFSFDADAPGDYTFTRSGAVGSYVDSSGVLQSAAANTLRRDYVYDSGVYVPTVLLEAARTNLVDSDDLTAWFTSGTPVVTGSVDGPAGGTGAYTVEDDDGAAAEIVFRNVTFTGDGTKSATFVVRENTMASSGVQLLAIYDTTATAYRLALQITSWSGGEPSITAANGTYLGSRYIGNGYWAIYGQTTSVTAANTNRAEVWPAFTSSATGSIDVYRVNAFDATVPSHSILDASEVRNADNLSAGFAHAPQAMTAYIKVREWGTLLSGSTLPYLYIGSAVRFSLYGLSSGDLEIAHDNGPAFVSAGFSSGLPTYGDAFELCGRLYADGSVDGLLSVEEGTVASTGQSGAAALADEWDEETVRVGVDASPTQGLAGFESVKVARGVQTMATMRKLRLTRPHALVA